MKLLGAYFYIRISITDSAAALGTKPATSSFIDDVSLS